MSVLVLGSGLVAKPVVDYLSKKYQVTLASRTLSKIEAITKDYANATPVQCDAEKDTEMLEILVQEHTIIISMLPYIHHKIPFDMCLKYRKHFLTTSYTQDHMKEQGDEIKDKGIIVVNEAGVMPGLTEASAKQRIDHHHSLGRKINSFKTYCGGLPSLEANDNPFGYKFSWAPRGVLLAERNGATYLDEGVVYDPKTRVEVFDRSEPVTTKVGLLEGIANRDSIKFIPLYGIPEANTVIRGTLRFYGWSDIMRFFHKYDLLSIDEVPILVGQSYLDLLANRMIVAPEEVESTVREQECGRVYDALKFLDLFNPDVKIPGTLESATTLDAIAVRMSDCMGYKPGERDMIPMIHEFEVWDGPIIIHEKMEAVFYGDGTTTAMEMTVGTPVAVVADLILSGKFTKSGLHILNIPELYEPVMEYMTSIGYGFDISSTPADS